MTLLTLMSPFSQKYLLKEGWLHDQGSSIHLRIYTNLAWHFTSSPNQAYLASLPKGDDPSVRDFELFASELGGVIHNQPVWDMGDCLSERRLEPRGEVLEEDRRQAPPQENPDGGPLPASEWQMERLAYYVAAHHGLPDRYGIHVLDRSVVKVAQEVHDLCPGEPLAVLQMAALYLMYAHELCHAWIEDICALVDFSVGEKAPLEDRRYTRVKKRFNSYIFMEEALCNTAAYGWLHHFLTDAAAGGPGPAVPPFNAQAILASFGQWMRGQPMGYSNFLAIEEKPVRSKVFIQNLCRLMVEIYGSRQYPEWIRHGWMIELQRENYLSGAIQTYFGCRLHAAEYISFDREWGYWDELWGARSLPLHVEN